MAQPVIPAFPDIKDQESLARIEQYLVRLQRLLKYQFAHIDESNIQDGAITEKKLTEALIRKIKDTYGNSSEFLQTASKIRMMVQNLEIGAASLDLTVGGIATRVTNVEGDVSALEQTATSIATRVSDAEGDISTLTQTASGIATRVTNAEGDISTLEQTATGLGTRITNAEGDVSALEQTASGLLTRVSTAEGDISTLEQTATSFGTRITNTEGDISAIDQTVDGIATRVSTAEGDISTINQTVRGISSTVSSYSGQISAIDQKADNISLAVSQEKVWRAATETALNTALSAAGITKAAGLLWYDTTNNVVKRWTGTAWANTFVNTSQIVIDDDSIDIGTTGTLNVQAGGNLNIKNLSGTGNVINMDSTGLALSSTGQLKLQSTDSIIIGGSPFSVGGTNFYSKSTAYGTYTDAGTLVVIGRDQAGYENGFYVTGPQGSSNNYLRLLGVITENGYWTVSFDIRGTQGVAVPVTVDICDSGATTYYTNATDTYERKSLTVNVTNFSEIYNFVDFAQFGFYYYNIRNIKIEKGTIATDWSPSPQDTIDALDGLDGRLGDIETRVQVFYQTTKPTYTAVGDLWYDTDSNPLEVWQCTNVATQAHTAFTDPVLTRALSAQTTANSKIVTFVQSDTPSAQAAGDLWLDTGSKNIWKRATAAGTGGWVPYLTAAGYLNSTGITIDDTDLTVKATGNLNLVTDSNLNVQGGKINMAALSDITVNSGGFLSAVASAIDLSANNSIKLAVSGVKPGARNYFANSKYAARQWTQAGWQQIFWSELGFTMLAGHTYYVTFYGTRPPDSNYILHSSDYSWTQMLTTGIYAGEDLRTTKITPLVDVVRPIISTHSASADPSAWFKYTWATLEETTNPSSDWYPAASDPAGGVKAAGIEIGPGIMRQYADLDWSMTAGSGASEIGIANKRADGLFVWGGGSPTAAKIRMWMDGSARFDQIMIGNSGVNQFTQMYPYTDADNADDLNSMILKVFVPADCSGVQSLKLSFALEAFRAYSKGAASGGEGTSGSNNQVTSVGYASISAPASGTTSGPTGNSTGNFTVTGSNLDTPHSHTLGSHTHTFSHVHDDAGHQHSLNDHTHTTPNHTHPITYGIYAGPVATSCQVIVDGVNIGSFASLTAQDITAQLAKVSGKVTRDIWHTIELKPNGLTRIVAQAFLVAVVATATNAIY